MLASQNIKLMLLYLNIIAIIANTEQKLASVGISNKKLANVDRVRNCTADDGKHY